MLVNLLQTYYYYQQAMVSFFILLHLPNDFLFLIEPLWLTYQCLKQYKLNGE